MKKQRITKLIATLTMVFMLLTMLASCAELQSLQGPQGPQGEQGVQGEQGIPGTDGADGVGIVNTMVDNKGHLIIYYSDGTFTDCGVVTGANGAPGKDGVDGKDGTNGTDGKDGIDGAPGKDGATIAKVEFDDEGRLVITLTDGAVLEPVELPEKEEHVHTFSEWINYPGNDNIPCENRLFYHICTECNTLEWQSGSYEHHTFVTETIPATCTAGGYDAHTCSICGKIEISNETPKIGHDYSGLYVFDSEYHWKECKECGEVNAKDHHVIEDGICIVCDPSAQPTEGVIYEVSADGTYAEVIGYMGNSAKIRIADEYMGLPVKVIYKEAFHENRNITSVVIPDSVTSISDYAFYSCTSLTSVVIPDSVTSIGNYAFYWCTSLTSVVIPDSVTSIGFSAFTGCNSALYTEYEYGRYVGNSDNPYQILIGLTNANFTSYTIHEDTQIIGYGVFSSCERLTNITIPDSVTSIGERAFYSCDSLTSVVIPDSVISIGSQAFSHCTSLTSVLIPDSVTSIGSQAFQYCSSLTSVVIPDSVTSIGSQAFYYCSSLKDVYYTGSAEDWAKISIGSDNYYLTNATRHYNYVAE